MPGKTLHSDREPCTEVADRQDGGADGQRQSTEAPPANVCGDARVPEPTTANLPAGSARRSASIFPGPSVALPDEFCAAVGRLEGTFKIPIWLLIQGRSGKYQTISEHLVRALRRSRCELPKGQRIGLVIDSSGGDARAAYQTAMLIRRRCGGFLAIIPRRAKSAATLLTLGADGIALGTDGELGPLDAQFMDPDREDVISALDEFQALERLHAFALEAVDSSMMLMVPRTRKKLETLMPLVLKFVTDMTRPLFESVDAVHYTQMARALKVAEDYAVRLLRQRYGDEKAEQVARHLVQQYPEHGFVIDAQEADSFGLKTIELSVDQLEAVDTLSLLLDDNDPTVFGCLMELKPK